MAGRIVRDVRLFEYVHYNCFLSRLNPGLKLSSMIIICIASASLPPVLLPLPAALLIPLLLTSGRSVLRQMASMWKLYIFFLITGIVKFATTDSLIEGAAFSVRMILMMFTGVLFYSTTRLSALHRSLKKILSSFKFINGDRIAEMTIMAVTFLPVIFKTMDELHQARTARGFRPAKNILRTIKLTSIPLMINMFLKTDEIADAWYSRGYNPHHYNT